MDTGTMRTNEYERRASASCWIRRVLLVGLATVVSVVLADWGVAAWLDLRALPASPAATPADAVADVAAVLALGAWTWLLLGAVLTVFEASVRLPGRRWAPRIAPTTWRRLVLSAVGIGMLSTPAGIAAANPGGGAHVISAALGPDRGSASSAAPAQAIRGLPLPDRPLGRLRAGPRGAADQDASAPSDAATRVTVRSGDSLWTIAERHLGPHATVQAITAEWRRWYAVNRACIGPDPNLIHPGMVLHAPKREAAS